MKDTLTKEMFNVFDTNGKIHYYTSKRDYYGTTALFDIVDTSSVEYKRGVSKLMFKCGLLLNEFSGEDFFITYKDNKTIVYAQILRSNSWDSNKVYENLYLIIDYDTNTIKQIVDGLDVKVSNDFTIKGLSEFTVTKLNTTYNILKTV